jgi:4-hydroxybenzoate polyprenyltransferase
VTPAGLQETSGPGRWWIYQRERFPVVSHGMLVAAFSVSAVCFSALLRGANHFPAPVTVVVAFLSSFLFFLLLRIADEFKDFEEDSRYRPYRPVPRGLVTLGELRVVAAIGALVQTLLAIWLAPGMLILLVGVWAYLALMTREFFVSRWLREHPVHYLWSHMLILPLIDVYVSACDWWRFGALPSGLAWLLALSFLNGTVVELGRKIRAPEDEELGVETYTFLWGRRGAICVWLSAMTLAGIMAVMAGRRVGFGLPVAALSAILVIASVMCAARFLTRPVAGSGKSIERISGVWTVLVYTSCGIIPMLLSSVGAR